MTISNRSSSFDAFALVRNKIIHRVFACIRDNRKYEKIYATALV